MKMKNKEATRTQDGDVVELRKQHAERVKQAQELFKEQQRSVSAATALQGAPHSVPQLAERRVYPLMRSYGTLPR